jgi:hypothetical protein
MPWTRPTSVPDVLSHNLIVAAFGELNPKTLSVLGHAMPRGGNLTVISESCVDIPKGPYKARWVKGHPASAAVLERAGAASADALLVAGVDKWSDTEADIQVR